MDRAQMDKYTKILKSQLVPAQGCTEPIAIAYASAVLRKTLGAVPDNLEAKISRNIIKNTKSVTVPNTGGLKGMEAAIAAGIIAGDSSKVLEVIANVDESQHSTIKEYMSLNCIHIDQADVHTVFEIYLVGEKDGHRAVVEISDTHTNVVYIEHDGEIILDKRKQYQIELPNSDEAHDLLEALTVKEIIKYVNEVPIEDIEELIKRQIEYNTRIAQDALRKDYGANIGRILFELEDNSVQTRARAMAAAGSDGRMSGSELPVIIVCGSGNQGITASLPIAEYAKYYEIDDEKLYRAVALADLLAVHLKAGIGTLSAFCGAVCAGCAAGAGICYLLGGEEMDICVTFVNALSIVSGMICDGAKPSCAAKIAAAVDAGILGYEMTKSGYRFHSGDGLVAHLVEDNIKNIAKLGREGMKDTDNKIMEIMLDK